MEKRITFLYIVFSILFVLLTFSLSALRVYHERQLTVAASQTSFAALQRSLRSAYTAGGGFDSEPFRSTARQYFQEIPSIRAFVIYSYDTGTQYLLSRNSGYLEKSSIDPRVTAVSRLSAASLTEELLSSALLLPDHRGIVMEGVYTVVSRSTIFPVLRDLLIAFSVFFLLTVILILVVTMVRPAPEPVPIGEDSGVDDREEDRILRGEDALTGLDDLDEILSPDIEAEVVVTDEADCLRLIERALGTVASGDRDLVLALSEVPGEGGTARAVELARTVAGFFPGVVARLRSDGAVMILLEGRRLDDAIRNLERLSQDFYRSTGTRLHAGLTTLAGRSIGAERFLKEASGALSRTRDAEGERIIGFRPDPRKYTEYLSGRGA